MPEEAEEEEDAGITIKVGGNHHPEGQVEHALHLSPPPPAAWLWSPPPLWLGVAPAPPALPALFLSSGAVSLGLGRGRRLTAAADGCTGY